MKTDAQLCQEVVDALRSDAQIQSIEIGIWIKDGVVILTGYADSRDKKGAAEQIAKRIAGVKGVVNDIQLRVPSAGERTNAEIARDTVEALDRCVNLPHDRVKFVVCDRWVTLEGLVGRYDQCEDAEESVRELSGVLGVTNLIIVKPTIAPEDIKARIEESFRRAAHLDAQQIVVATRDRTVVLRGRVRSWAERAEAWRVAWQISGVTRVENLIEVAS